MAQLFHIPIEFEFMVTPTKWASGTAAVEGYWRDEFGDQSFTHLRAEITGRRGRTASVPFPIGNLRKKELDEWYAGYEDHYGYSDTEVKEICASFKPTVLFRSGREYSSYSQFVRHSTSADAWQLREEFLRTKINEESAIAFLNKWGRWDKENCVEVADLVSLQRKIRRALTSPPTKWLSRTDSFPDTWFHSQYPYFGFINDSWRHLTKYPYFGSGTNQCRHAICMTVTLDLLARSEFKICARPDCRLPFAVSSQHARKYCSQYCGHLESVRRNRKEAKTNGEQH
jgi:hypothetical protein